MQSFSQAASKLHIGIIMDGNGRWAEQRGLCRTAGHEEGVKALRRIVEAAPAEGIGTLTLYAFSSDNWRRPQSEVKTLMALLRSYLNSEPVDLARQGVRLSMIGRRDRLPLGLPAAMGLAETMTAKGTRLHLRIAVDYSARDDIVRAAEEAAGRGALSRARLSEHLARDACDVDLVIRTGGEKRLSDFLLWESAYAELHFTDRMWPDFTPADLADALAAFRRRERRFGGLGAYEDVSLHT